MALRRAGWGLLGPLLLLVLGAGGAQADTREPLAIKRARAERLVAQGRCEEALPLLSELRAARAGDPRPARLQGECLIRLGRYREAVEPLETALRLRPEAGELALDLVVAHFHAGELDAAQKALERVRGDLGARAAELELYRGLILLERARLRESAAALERAGALDPQAVDPVASYYAGLAWASAGERRRAERALRRARERAGSGPWAQRAERALARLQAARVRRAWLRATAGVEYDDNVVLRGAGVELPREIAGQNDVRGVWNLEAGWETWRNADWSTGILATYAGTAHQDLSPFNLHNPSVLLWLDRRLGERSFLRFELDSAYAWVDADPFLFSWGGGVSLERTHERFGASRLFARLARHDYLFPVVDVVDGTGVPGDPCAGPSAPVAFCGPPGLDESHARLRDGVEVAVGLEQRLAWGARTELALTYTHRRFDARGRDYSFQAHEAELRLRERLPWGVVASARGAYRYRPYRHPSTFPAPRELVFNTQYGLSNTRRRDRVWEVGAGLERRIVPGVIVSARYTFLRNESNVDVFDYRREVMGLYLTVAWDRLGGAGGS